MTAGYSGKALTAKLGIKPGQRLAAVDSPAPYLDLVKAPPDIALLGPRATGLDLLHLFVTSHATLARKLPGALKRIQRDGMIWVSWPKKSSGFASDMTEDVVRAVALPLGLVDVKVCAVDQTWSALKLVIRRELR